MLTGDTVMPPLEEALACGHADLAEWCSKLVLSGSHGGVGRTWTDLKVLLCNLGCPSPSIHPPVAVFFVCSAQIWIYDMLHDVVRVLHSTADVPRKRPRCNQR